MTERFSAPGATLVKLFGRPADESAEFAVRARRVRDIGGAQGHAAVGVRHRPHIGVGSRARPRLRSGRVLRAARPARGRRRGVAGAAAHPAVLAAHVARQRPRRRHDAMVKLRARVRDPRSEAAHRGQARRGRGAVRSVSVEFRKRWLRVPRGRQGLSSRRSRRSRHSTPAADPPSCTTLSFRVEPARWWRSSGRPVRASRPSRACSPASTTPIPVRCCWPARHVRDLKSDSIRRTVGMVTRDGHLFHESVRANLPTGPPGASEDELWEGCDGRASPN